MKKSVLRTVIPIFILISVLTEGNCAEALAVWSAVDWSTVDEEIDSQGKQDKNIDVSTGISMEVPADTLKKIAGSRLTLAFQTGDGIAVSASGRDLKAVERDLKIRIVDELYSVSEDVVRKISEGTLYSRVFAMEEKENYDIYLNIHFNVGKEYAGKYANLYYYDEQAEQMVCGGSFVITDKGRAMFPLKRGDEYILTVTERLPVGGKIPYKVAEGDSLSRIAVRNGVSVKELLRANPSIEDADKIYTGKTITIAKY